MYVKHIKKGYHSAKNLRHENLIDGSQFNLPYKWLKLNFSGGCYTKSYQSYQLFNDCDGFYYFWIRFVIKACHERL